MKRFLVVFLLVVLASSLFLMSCSSGTTSSTTAVATTTAKTTAATTTTSAPMTTTSTAPMTTTPTAPQPQYGGTLKIIVRSSLGNLGSPSEGTTAAYLTSAAPAIQSINIVERDWTPLITPSTLASSYDISPDGKTITLHLRQGIKFQDGTDFNAEAVKYNLENFRVNGVTYPTLRNVSSFNVIDPYTLQINLIEFDSYFVTNLGRGSNMGMMASPAAISINSTPENAVKDHMVGTGPFKFVSYQRDVLVRYEKWDGYWEQGKPYLDAIELRQITEPTTGIMAFKAGEAHLIAGLSPQEASELKAEGFEIIISNTMTPIVTLVPNGSDPESPFSDIRVREALEYAIDKKALSDALGYGLFEPVYQFATSLDSRYVDGLPVREYDPEKAKQLLADAGYPDGFKTAIHAMNSTDKDYLVAVATYLKKVNIDAEVDLMDPPRFATIYAGWDGIMVSNFFGANLSGLNSAFGPPKSSAYNFSRVYKPADWLDKLHLALTEPDPVKRADMERALDAVLVNECMAIPINTNGFFAAQYDTVHDLDWGGHSNYQFQPQNAWLSEK